MAIDFDNGSSEGLYADTGSPLAYSFCVSAWWYLSLNNQTPLLVGTNNGSSNQSYRFYVKTDGAVCAGVAGGYSEVTATTSTTGSASTWHHAFASFESNTERRVWLDGGGENNQGSNRTPGAGNRIAIGYDGDGTPSTYGDGSIAEVATWEGTGSTFRSNTDLIVSLAKGVDPRFIRPDLLTHYWRLLGPDHVDLIGGLNLTNVATPQVAAHCPIRYLAPPIISHTATPSIGHAGGLVNSQRLRSKIGGVLAA